MCTRSKLEEINPQLAKDIVFLEGQIAYERSSLIANADTVANLDERLDALQQLETELGDLLKRPLDELTVEDLDEMLKRYSSVIDESTREALKQVLADFKKSLDDLQKELASLMSNFGDLTPRPPLQLRIAAQCCVERGSQRRSSVMHSIRSRGVLGGSAPQS